MIVGQRETRPRDQHDIQIKGFRIQRRGRLFAIGMAQDQLGGDALGLDLLHRLVGLLEASLPLQERVIAAPDGGAHLLRDGDRQVIEAVDCGPTQTGSLVETTSLLVGGVFGHCSDSHLLDLVVLEALVLAGCDHRFQLSQLLALDSLLIHQAERDLLHLDLFLLASSEDLG